MRKLISIFYRLISKIQQPQTLSSQFFWDTKSYLLIMSKVCIKQQLEYENMRSKVEPKLLNYQDQFPVY